MRPVGKQHCWTAQIITAPVYAEFFIFQVIKFTTTKGISYDIISGGKEVIKMREVVIRLMQRCEKISTSMEKVVHNLLHSSTELEDGEQITKQPGNLNQK